MIHALVLFLILLFFGKYAALIPMPTLAAILIVVAYNMSEWQEFKDLLARAKERRRSAARHISSDCSN